MERIFFLIIGGILFSLSFPGYDILPSCIIGFLALIIALKNTHNSKEAFKRSVIWGASHFLSLLYWLAPTMRNFGHIPIPLTIPPLVLLSLYLGCYIGIWGILFWRIAPLKRLYSSPFISALSSIYGGILWGVLEWLRGHLFTGFSWGAFSTIFHNHPIMLQLADVVGMYGLSAIFITGILSLIMPFLALTARDAPIKTDYKRLFMVFIANISVLSFIVISIILYGIKSFNYCHGENEIGVVAVQGGALLPEFVGGENGLNMAEDRALSSLNVYLSLTKEGIDRLQESLSNRDKGERITVAVWPETAVSDYFQINSLLQQKILNFAKRHRVYILFGSPSFEVLVRDEKNGEKEVRYFNSAYLIGPDGMVIGRYDKRHLVPFGEYLPLWGLNDILRRYIENIGDFEPGYRNGIRSKAFNIGVLICFESIFPEILQEDILEGNVDFIAALTNDAWFGQTPAPFQHESMGVLRAIEGRRWLIRSASTGISSIISPEGVRVKASRLFRREVLTSLITLNRGKSFFVRYGRYEFWGAILLLLILHPVLSYLFKQVSMGVLQRAHTENFKSAL